MLASTCFFGFHNTLILIASRLELIQHEYTLNNTSNLSAIKSLLYSQIQYLLKENIANVNSTV